MRTRQQILQERATVIGQAREIRTGFDSAEGEIPAEQLQQFNQLMERVGQLDAEFRQVEQVEAFDRLAAEQGQTEGRRSNPMPHQDPANARHRFSVTRAIACMIEGRRLDGFEGEVSAAIAEQSGTRAQGFYMPLDVDRRGYQVGPERRDLDATSGAGGVRTDTAGTMIDALTNAMFVTRLGATLMPNMNGNFRLPKQTAIAAATWKGAAAALDESNPTIGFIPFSPKRVGTYIDYDKDLVVQTSLSVDQIVMADLVRSVALKLDQTAINGSGSGAEPQGLIPALTGARVVPLGTNGAAPTWASVVQLEGAVDAGNALDGQFAYLTTPKGRSALKTVTKDAGSGRFLWDDQTDQVNSYPAYSSNQVPSNLTKGSGTNLSAVLFGNFSMVHIALWGGLDVIVNPYSQDINDLVRVSIRQQADVKFRHLESFSVIKDMVAA